MKIRPQRIFEKRYAMPPGGGLVNLSDGWGGNMLIDVIKR